MLKPLKEYGRYVEIAGFEAVAIGDKKDFVQSVRVRVPKGVEVQFFDASVIATWQHLFFAVLNALMAFKNRRNISKSLAVEIMLYASAQRQITKAIERVGVKPKSKNLVAVIIGCDVNAVQDALVIVKNCLGVEPNDSVLDLSKPKMQRIKRAFNISDVQLAVALDKKSAEQVLVDLVLETMALLSTQI
ncbi:MAG: KEOPS complex subunit Cgi121 [Candidatus Bathyarchaeota archaeon]|nr:KEOPS complex subunit Cgi121 [Candidatus Bathyarchaeota archaeon]